MKTEFRNAGIGRAEVGVSSFGGKRTNKKEEK